MGIGVTTATVGASTGYVGNALPFINLGTGVVATSIAGGYQHVCALSTDKKVKCYGRCSWGILGYGDTSDRGAQTNQMGNNLPYIDFGTEVEVASVHSSPSSAHNCVILSRPTTVAQRVKCWGFNDFYQLGYGDRNHRGDVPGEMGDNLPLVDLGTESRVKQLSLGGEYTCILLVNDLLKCFGSGGLGQLASGSITIISSTGNSLPFVQIDSGKTIKLITAGACHTCIMYGDNISN